MQEILAHCTRSTWCSCPAKIVHVQPLQFVVITEVQLMECCRVIALRVRQFAYYVVTDELLLKFIRTMARSLQECDPLALVGGSRHERETLR